MSVAQTPNQRIAILGAGPIGIEAALQAKNLGYSVNVYERGKIADHVLQWGHVKMFSPFGMNRSDLGRLKLEEGQGPPLPSDDDLLTGREWVERYLLPLTKLPWLEGCIHQQTEVLRVGRRQFLKSDLPGSPNRGDSPFCILMRDLATSEERFEEADIVIDTTGVFDQPNWMGTAGTPAVGELGLRNEIKYSLPDILGQERTKYAGRHTLVVGSGYSAATNIVALAQLASETAGTKVTWVTRSPASDEGPIPRISEDRLAYRDQLSKKANDCIHEQPEAISHLPETQVEAIRRDSDGPFIVDFSGKHAGRQTFDRIIANVGFRGDSSLFEELQIHQCYASGGPMKLAAALLGQAATSDDGALDCLNQQACGPDSLKNPEPNFYILGSKSYGRNSNFLISIGLEQIREVFSLIHAA